ncbi:hypothetical protein D3C80_1731800 [compost metagenome]
MLVLDWRLTRNGHILAHFARRLDGLFDRLHGQHLSVFRPTLDQVVGGYSTSGSHTDRTQNRTHQH